MTQANFDTAVAIKEELRQIDVLLTTAGGPPAPFARAQNFHQDFAAMLTLSQPLLDDANDGWTTTLTNRKTTLEAQFDALGS